MPSYTRLRTAPADGPRRWSARLATMFRTIGLLGVWPKATRLGLSEAVLQRQVLSLGASQDPLKGAMNPVPPSASMVQHLKKRGWALTACFAQTTGAVAKSRARRPATRSCVALHAPAAEEDTPAGAPARVVGKTARWATRGKVRFQTLSKPDQHRRLGLAWSALRMVGRSRGTAQEFLLKNSAADGECGTRTYGGPEPSYRRPPSPSMGTPGARARRRRPADAWVDRHEVIGGRLLPKGATMPRPSGMAWPESPA